MLHWLRRNSELKRTAHQLYERIVAQARSETFYRDMSVPDTMEGRFEMIVLHLFLVRERLKGEGEDGQKLGQIVLEKLISDMDDALRQIGYDMAVPKRVKKAVNAFAERSAAYGAALEPGASSPGDSQLQAALLRHVYGDVADPDDPRLAEGASGLAAYVRRAVATVAATRSSAVLAGDIDFPPAGPHA